MSGVFTLRSKGQAKAALRSARHGFKRLKGVGDEAWKRTTATKKRKKRKAKTASGASP
jgi:hypothetical protein